MEALLELVKQEETVQLIRCLWKLVINPRLAVRAENSSIKIFERGNERLVGEISEAKGHCRYFCVVYVKDPLEPNPIEVAWLKAGLSPYAIEAFKG